MPHCTHAQKLWPAAIMGAHQRCSRWMMPSGITCLSWQAHVCRACTLNVVIMRWNWLVMHSICSRIERLPCGNWRHVL